MGIVFSSKKKNSGAEKPKILAALGNISLISMLTTKMRFYSNLANYPPRVGGSIFSFGPTGGVSILPGCEPTAKGTWVGEGSRTLEHRMLRAPSVVQCLSILKMLSGWGFSGP